MADETVEIARVALARDLRRILALPLILALIGASAIAGGLLLGGLNGMVTVAGGIAVIAGAIVLAIVPLSLRMDVEVGGLRVRWLGGARRFHLTRGPVTRVSLAGRSAGSIRSRISLLGWSMGRAVLRGEERIVLIRMGRTRSVIVVPTDAGRLAIAAASEPDLIDALGAAARVQQRLDEVSGRVLAAFPEGLSSFEERARAVRPTREAQAAEEAEPRYLTGIERARLEERLAAAREAALMAAEAERRAMLEGSGVPPARDATAAEAAPAPTRRAIFTTLSRSRQRTAGAWTRPAWATEARLRTLGTIGWALVPLGASLLAWSVAQANRPFVVDGATWAKLVAVALTLCGPAAALGVIAARTWWPRLTGLITMGALASLILTTRAVLP